MVVEAVKETGKKTGKAPAWGLTCSSCGARPVPTGGPPRTHGQQVGTMGGLFSPTRRPSSPVTKLGLEGSFKQQMPSCYACLLVSFPWQEVATLV